MANQENTLLWHFVEHWATVKPEAEALVYEDTRMNWKDFAEAVDRCARAYLELGVQRGDRIAMVAMGRPEFVISYMAASKIGAIWLGISPKFSTEEVRYILGHCEPTVLITLDEYMGVDLLDAGITFGQEFASIQGVWVIGKGSVEGAEDYYAVTSKERPELDDALAARMAEVRPEHEVLLMYTSGSTGRPKGVLQTQEAIIKNIEVEVEYMGFDEDGRALLHFPINHVAADVEIAFAAILSGGAIVFMDRFDPQASLETIEKERITMVGQVPVMFLMQFQAPKFMDMDWSSVKCIVWGGSSAPQLVLDVLSHIASQTGARLLTGYGSTELCGFVTYSRPGDSVELLAKSAGKVTPPFEVKIVDENRQPLPQGEVGEIVVRGPSVMAGYLNNPTATKEVLDDEGWYYTSDLGYLDADDNLFISGRRSEMFKTGGENVFPREVEDVLEAHPAVLFAAVIGVKDEVYSEVGRAYIMLKPGQEATDVEMREFCKERLANFKVPKAFDIRPMLPLLANGKVNKMALRAEMNEAQA